MSALLCLATHYLVSALFVTKCLSTVVTNPVQCSGGLEFADRPGGKLHLVFVFSLTFFDQTLEITIISSFISFLTPNTC